MTCVLEPEEEEKEEEKEEKEEEEEKGVLLTSYRSRQKCWKWNLYCSSWFAQL
jgi:hypothetical protein